MSDEDISYIKFIEVSITAWNINCRRRAQFVLFVDYMPTELDEYVVDKEPHYTHDFETVFIKTIEFLIHNIFVMFGGCVFQQTVDIPMDTNSSFLLVASYRDFNRS